MKTGSLLKQLYEGGIGLRGAFMIKKQHRLRERSVLLNVFL